MGEVAIRWTDFTREQRLAHPRWPEQLAAVKKSKPRQPICGELGYVSRRTGLPCGAVRRESTGLGCTVHGRNQSRPGPAHPQWKTGEHARSRYDIPGRSGEGYRKHRADENPLDLSDEIALTKNRLEQAEVRLASLTDAPEAPQDGPAGLVQARQRAKEAEALRGELRALNAQLARHVEVQGKLIKDAADTLRGDQIDLYAQRLLESVRRHALAITQDVDERVEGFLRWLEDGMRPQGGVPAELREKVLALKLGSARALRAVGDVQDDERRLVLNLTGREP